MSFKAAIWDFDGTLFNTYPGILKAFERVLEENGVKGNPEKILKLMKDYSVGHAHRYYKEHTPLKDNFMDRYHEYETGLDKRIAQPYPYAREVCRDIKNSGGMNFLFTHRDNTAVEYLELHDMTKYFTEMVTKEKGLKSKPAPDPFLYFIDKYHLEKDSVLSVGDRNIEVLSAKAAGVQSCFFKSNDAVLTSEPDYTVNSLEELYPILGIKPKACNK